MTLRSLRTVAATLPFHLDDTTQANEAFLRWHRHQAAGDKRIIDIWTYCYIYRYFMIKFAPAHAGTPPGFDRLIATAFADVQQHLHSIRQPDCYTGWVSTICKHTFINYLRSRRCTVSLEQDSPVLGVEEPALSTAHDAVVVHQTVSTAVEALPEFLRDITRMRLLENRSYEAISRQTGKSLATLRAYVNRAMSLLRQDENLRTLLEELRD